MNIQDAIEKAERIIQNSRRAPNRRVYPPDKKWYNLGQKLTDLYCEESEKNASLQGLCHNVHLLGKLTMREKLSCLVVNLYPGNEGYSLMLKTKQGTETETIRLPYEESEFLDYLDAEELPPILVDLLEKSQVGLFYNGCVITEVRDYRRSENRRTFESSYVLLRPTPQTLIGDINTLTSGVHKWTQEDRLNLESQLILATQEPLCLDPSPVVGIVANRLNYNKNKYRTHTVMKNCRRHSQVMANIHAVMSASPAPKQLALYDFINRNRGRRMVTGLSATKVGKNKVDCWRRQSNVELSIPPEPELNVEKYAKKMERPQPTTDNTPITVSDVILESDRGNGCLHHARLTIKQRLSDMQFIGELFVDRNFRPESKHEPPKTCKFVLGTKRKAEKYIHQFEDLFTEEGRKQVKITRLGPGQMTHITHTQTPGTSACVTPTVTPQSHPTTAVVSAAAAPVHPPASVTAQKVTQSGIIIQGDLGQRRLSTAAGSTIRLSLTPGGLFTTAPGGQQITGNTNLANLLAGNTTVSTSSVAGGHIQLSQSLLTTAAAINSAPTGSTVVRNLQQRLSMTGQDLVNSAAAGSIMTSGVVQSTPATNLLSITLTGANQNTATITNSPAGLKFPYPGTVSAVTGGGPTDGKFSIELANHISSHATGATLQPTIIQGDTGITLSHIDQQTAGLNIPTTNLSATQPGIPAQLIPSSLRGVRSREASTTTVIQVSQPTQQPLLIGATIQTRPRVTIQHRPNVRPPVPNTAGIRPSHNIQLLPNMVPTVRALQARQGQHNITAQQIQAHLIQRQIQQFQQQQQQQQQPPQPHQNLGQKHNR